jgi:alpha-1,2-mannosyltransferase
VASEDREFPDRLWLSVLGIAAFATAVGAHIWTIHRWPKDLWWLVDMQVYRAGGQAVRDGVPLYDHGVYGPMQFTYTPFAALGFTPLTLVSMESLRFAVTAVNLVSLLVVVWMCWGYLGYRANHGRLAMTFLVGGFALWLEPVRSTVLFGQINLLLLILVMADFGRRDLRGMRGICVGIAAAVKLTPLLFVVYFVVTRRFRAAAVSLVTLLVTVIIGFVIIPRDSAKYWGGAFFDAKRAGDLSLHGNQSITGLLARELHADKAPTPLWLGLSGLAVIVGLALAAWAHRYGEELLAITIVGITACLISPVSWTHHWVWAVPLLVIGVHFARTWRPWVLAALGAYWLLFFPWVMGKPLRADAPPPMGITVSTARSGWRLLVYSSLYVWIAVALFAATAWYLSQQYGWRSRADRPVPSEPPEEQSSALNGADALHG